MRYVILSLLTLALVPAVASAEHRDRSSRSGFSVGFGHSERSSGWGERSSSRFDASFRIGSDRYERRSYGRYDHYRGDHYRRDYYRHDYGRGDWGHRGYYHSRPVYIAPPPVYYCPPPVYQPPVVIYRSAPAYCAPPGYYYPQRGYEFHR